VEKEVDIEADISAELDSLRPQRASTHGLSQSLSFVTLDIPCVSFVRFPARSAVDPVEVVRKICLNASKEGTSSPRSRYIKRLTPVSLVRKTLNDGLESLCNQILPKHFLVDCAPGDAENNPEGNGRPLQTPCKFAIRPTIRNNNKINRDELIRTVADRVTSLGKHTVDLKGYDKLVLVDVYRNIIGMSVVGSEYETLKRFNLAELHASRFGDDDKNEKI
jgi:tRNA acetyltransferase TAN1